MRGPRYGSDRRRVSVRELWRMQEEGLTEWRPMIRGAERIDAPLTQSARYVGKTLFTFSTSELNKTDRVRFFYGLKGRGSNKGIVEDSNGVHLGPGVVIVPKRYAQAMESFLASFGSEYSRKDIWVLQRSRSMRIKQAFESRSVR